MDKDNFISFKEKRQDRQAVKPQQLPEEDDEGEKGKAMPCQLAAGQTHAREATTWVG